MVESPETQEGQTWLGTSTDLLSSDCRSGRILSLQTPAVIALTAFPIPIEVQFENTSPCRWPAVAIAEEGLVGLSYSWTNPQGQTLPRGPFSRLLMDPEPGKQVNAPVMVIPPFGEPGRWQLDVYLEQSGARVPITRASTSVDVVPMRP